MGVRTWLQRHFGSPKVECVAKQPESIRSAAYDRFIKSTKIGYIEWHDGIGYDLDAFRALSPAERNLVIDDLSARNGPAFDWRDIEVFQIAATPESVATLNIALHSSRADSRLHAAAALHAMGALPALNNIVASELDHVTIPDGMAYALGPVGSTLTPPIRDALLRGARDRPEVGPLYAAKLCQLIGKTTSDFDWSMRPFFLRFGAHSPASERTLAFHELCEMAGVTMEPPDPIA